MSEKVAIMTSGGDSAGMNPAVKCAADYARRCGMTPYLVEWGLRGLIDDLIVEATPDRLSGMLHRGGTILGSSRSKRFFEYAFRLQAYENLRRRGITKMVVIGGDGSFQALARFHADFGVPFAGIPGTIDNDIPGTEYCLGVDTALNMIRQSIDSIRDTALSFSRAFVVETMGRDCGYLAMVSAITNGAEICLVPEIPYDLDSIAERLRQDKERGRTYVLAVVAEGTKMAGHLTRWMTDALGYDARRTTLGHVQRGGSPTVYDRLMAYKFAVKAIDSLRAGESNQIMVYRQGQYLGIPIQEVSDNRHQVDPALISLCEPLSR